MNHDDITVRLREKAQSETFKTGSLMMEAVEEIKRLRQPLDNYQAAAKQLVDGIADLLVKGGGKSGMNVPCFVRPREVEEILRKYQDAIRKEAA
jgi:hypothetical protein